LLTDESTDKGTNAWTTCGHNTSGTQSSLLELYKSNIKLTWFHHVHLVCWSTSGC